MTPLSPSQLEVMAGSVDAYDAQAWQVHAVTSARAHPGYPGTNNSFDDLGIGQEDDIAILLLADAVTNMVPATIMTVADFDAAVTARKQAEQRYGFHLNHGKEAA